MVGRVHIVGRKNSGKTTLVVELVSHLSAAGYRVGTVKHTHHHHELDTPGKDSFRHREAGAAVVGILAPAMTAVFRPTGGEGEVSDRYAELLATFAACDLVLVEGDAQARAARVEVWRAATHAEPLAIADPSIRAIVTDDAVKAAVPIWRRSDIAAISSRILELGGVKLV